jgi:uncharacterized protein YbjT (DUF2867 family)
MIMVTGATAKVGRHVAPQLLDTGVSVHGLARNPASVGLPGDVVCGDPSVPDTLDACLDGIEAGVLGWPFFTVEAAPAFLDAVTKHARRIVCLSSESVGDDLEQQTDTITARIAAELAV